MPTLRSHTHLQATQANAQPKLTNKYVCPTHNDRQKSTGGNSTFAIMAGEVRIQAVVQLIKFGGYRRFSVPNPPQRKAANRYAPF